MQETKKWCHSLKIFLYLHFLPLKFYYCGSHEALIMLQWATIKLHRRGYLFALYHHYIIILPPILLYYLYYHFHRIITSQFHQHYVLIHVFLYAHVSAVKTVIFDLFSLFWYNVIFLSSRINKGVCSVLCQSLPHFSKWHRGRNIGKKCGKVWQ